MATFWPRLLRRTASALMGALSLFDLSGQATIDQLQGSLGRQISTSRRDGFAADRAALARDWERVLARRAAVGAGPSKE